MSARLSSLLVAGGVLLTVVHPGVLKAAPAAEASPRKATLVSASLESEGTGARVLLRISGLAAKPGLQVLPQPNRVVLDLPGVARGTAVSREDLAQLIHPLILKARLAQFKEDPTPVTRLVLEVAPGTQVLVGVVPEGILLDLTPGEGRVQARLGAVSATPAAAPALGVPTPLVVPVLHLPALAVAQVAAETATPVSEAEAPKAAPRSLAPIPVLASSFHPLPQLVTATALPAAAPEAMQTPEPDK
ncbi:MAG: AMIN domain-containing protein, partial [Acidobacteria bacterium]|nr:AMIN domain-containing protein [Acidobacteriota bacterium]